MLDAQDYFGFPDNFVFLSVQTNNVPGATYYWMKDDKKITQDSRPRFSQYDRTTLLASSQGKEYAGTYQFVMDSPSVGIIAGRKINVAFTCKCTMPYKFILSAGLYREVVGKGGGGGGVATPH